MIERITDFSCLSGVDTPLLPLLYADFKYTAGEFGGTFIQKDEKGNVLCAFSVKNGCADFCEIGNSDFEEIAEFFDFLQIKTVTSESVLPIFRNYSEYNLMILREQKPNTNGCRVLSIASSLAEYKSVFEILSDGDGCFENWFAEFSKKVNNGNALAAYCVCNGKIVSAALAPAFYGENAVIAGVFTAEEYRDNGFASACLNKLVKRLKEKGVVNIRLWCDSSNTHFYEKNGFEIQSKIFIGK